MEAATFVFWINTLPETLLNHTIKELSKHFAKDIHKWAHDETSFPKILQATSILLETDEVKEYVKKLNIKEIEEYLIEKITSSNILESAFDIAMKTHSSKLLTYHAECMELFGISYNKLTPHWFSRAIIRSLQSEPVQYTHSVQLKLNDIGTCLELELSIDKLDMFFANIFDLYSRHSTTDYYLTRKVINVATKKVGKEKVSEVLYQSLITYLTKTINNIIVYDTITLTNAIAVHISILFSLNPTLFSKLHELMLSLLATTKDTITYNLYGDIIYLYIHQHITLLEYNCTCVNNKSVSWIISTVCKDLIEANLPPHLLKQLATTLYSHLESYNDIDTKDKLEELSSLKTLVDIISNI